MSWIPDNHVTDNKKREKLFIEAAKRALDDGLSQYEITKLASVCAYKPDDSLGLFLLNKPSLVYSSDPIIRNYILDRAFVCKAANECISEYFQPSLSDLFFNRMIKPGYIDKTASEKILDSYRQNPYFHAVMIREYASFKKTAAYLSDNLGDAIIDVKMAASDSENPGLLKSLFSPTYINFLTAMNNPKDLVNEIAKSDPKTLVGLVKKHPDIIYNKLSEDNAYNKQYQEQFYEELQKNPQAKTNLFAAFNLLSEDSETGPIINQSMNEVQEIIKKDPSKFEKLPLLTAAQEILANKNTPGAARLTLLGGLPLALVGGYSVLSGKTDATSLASLLGGLVLLYYAYKNYILPYQYAMSKDVQKKVLNDTVRALAAKKGLGSITTGTTGTGAAASAAQAAQAAQAAPAEAAAKEEDKQQSSAIAAQPTNVSTVTRPTAISKDQSEQGEAKSSETPQQSGAASQQQGAQSEPKETPSGGPIKDVDVERVPMSPSTLPGDLQLSHPLSANLYSTSDKIASLKDFDYIFTLPTLRRYRGDD